MGPVTQNMDPELLPKAPLWYWLVPAALIAFGTIAAASIGLPLLAFGIYLVLREIKGRPRRHSWPPIIGMVLFLASFWGIGYLFGPHSCSTIVNVRQEIGPGETEARTTIDNTRTTCDSPFLPKRTKGEAPSLWPVLWVAVGIGFGGASLTSLALAGGDSAEDQPMGEARFP
jgi:hypothetical protein